MNFIYGIVCLYVCVCAFSLRRESPDMILGDKPLIFRWFCHNWYQSQIRAKHTL
jgi:hypothetical protein